MLLDPAAFNRLLADMGQTAQWRRAYVCPCRNPRSGAAEPTCPQCAGLGYWWAGPVECLVAFSGQKLQDQWAKFGLWEQGDQVLTLPSDSPAYALGRFDRVTMVQSSVPINVVLRPGERLRGATHVDLASWMGNGALFSIANPPLDANGQPVFGDLVPPADAQIAVTGRMAPEFFALQDYPQDRAHHHGLALPRRVVVRRFDLFGRSAT